jgi:hypothetical protein
MTAAGYLAYHHHQQHQHQQRSRGGGDGTGQDINNSVQHSSTLATGANKSTPHENKSNMEPTAIIHGNNCNSTYHQQQPQQIMRSTQTARKLAKKWLASFRATDPRWKLAQFFCDELCQKQEQEEHSITGRILLQETSSILTTTSSVFTVWRPTSAVSIRLMMAGMATGKGLEIKGKSSKAGQLSGFVPFLQIHEEQHKTAVGTIAKSGRVRVFFSTRKERDTLLVLVERVRDEMLLAVEQAKDVILQSIKRRLSLKHTTNSSSGGDNEHDPSSYRVRVHKAIAKFKKSTIVKSSSSSPRASSPMTVKGFAIVSQEENDEREMALHRLLLWDMMDPSIESIHDYAYDSSSSSSSGSQKQKCCFGIDIPSRLLWQALVVDADISRPYGTKHYTGRPSQPAFQDLNWMAINKTRRGENNENENNEERRVVLWYICSNNSDKDKNDNDDDHNNNSYINNSDLMGLDPRNLVMAYEEHGRVLPVVSDFDCFTMGTRGIDYKNSSLPADQVVLIQWCLDRIEGVLDKQQQKDTSSTNWTSRWLEVLKKSAVQGFHPFMPKFGFGDVQSYHIMERAVAGLQETGAVRHGAECFNYYFPQELDAEFLIVYDEAPPSQGGTSSSKKKRKAAVWQYVNVQQLQSFLLQKIEQGFTFPLNPKWILCDGDGWKDVYNRLLSSHRPDVEDSLNVWFPPDSGIRQRIESISARYPNGFVVSSKPKQDKDGIIEEEEEDEVCGTEAMDLATLELDRYLTLKRAKAKVRAAVKFGHLATMLRQEHPAIAMVPSPSSTVA